MPPRDFECAIGGTGVDNHYFIFLSQLLPENHIQAMLDIERFVLGEY